jgi:membrane protease YdiL (CAAX protease family)
VGCYLFLALTAAICEEIIYRGYLQRQFTGWRASIGIVLQGMIFGASHSYQGKTMLLTICVYGCLFGLLARWRDSLRPEMMAHFLQDGVGGLPLAAHGLK